MNFKASMESLMNGHTLTTPEAYTLMTQIGEGAFNEGQNAALIIALSCRDVTLEEIIGFREALWNLSIPINLQAYDAIDLCGTGGDEKNTFNISTLASIIVAAAGYQVAKHGNYGVSSVCGSSNVLEKLGYRFSNDTSKLESELMDCNICFLHAPLFHPALKNVAGVRKQLGMKTIFNTLGPLVNPARTRKQFAGVYNLKLARLYHYLLQQDGKDYAVVHTMDGYDEISLTTPTQFFSSAGERILTHDDFGLRALTPESLYGGESVEDAVTIFINVLDNASTMAQTHASIANAAAAIQCFEKGKSLSECVALSNEMLISGKAKEVLQKLLKKQSHAH